MSSRSVDHAERREWDVGTVFSPRLEFRPARWLTVREEPPNYCIVHSPGYLNLSSTPLSPIGSARQRDQPSFSSRSISAFIRVKSLASNIRSSYAQRSDSVTDEKRD